MATLEHNVEKNIEKLEVQLKLWNTRLAELIARGKATGQEVKVESRKRIDEFKSRIDVAQTKLAEVKKAGTGHWEEFRVGIEGAWKQAEAAFKKLVD
jgi:predicted  nucleic acid-binding Zn-ribbon protein